VFTNGGTVIYYDHRGSAAYGVIEGGTDKHSFVNIGSGQVIPFANSSLEVIL
jgi:hypothetical protein